MLHPLLLDLSLKSLLGFFLLHLLVVLVLKLGLFIVNSVVQCLFGSLVDLLGIDPVDVLLVKSFLLLLLLFG